MTTYQKRKNAARMEAIIWQHEFADRPMYESELAYYTAYFRKLGKRYGLLGEFRENGII